MHPVDETAAAIIRARVTPERMRAFVMRHYGHRPDDYTVFFLRQLRQFGRVQVRDGEVRVVMYPETWF